MIDKNVIKKTMIDQGVKGVELAERLGMTAANFSSFCNKQKFTQQDLQRLADALGVVYVSEFRPK